MVKGELPVVGCRVPHSLDEKLQALCQETGDSKSKVLQDALSAYLGVNTPESVATLSKRVAALERQFKKLAQLI